MSWYNKLYNKVKVKREDYIINNLEINKDSKVLVLGAFENTIENILKQTGLSVIYSTDIENRVEEGKKNIIFKKADLNIKIPFEDDYFDYVIADQLIEHLKEPDIFLEEVHRVLKKGGRAVISTENLAHIRNILLLALGYPPVNQQYSSRFNLDIPFLSGYKKEIADPYMCHHKLTTPRILEDLLILNNFKIIKKHYLNIINPIVIKRYCYFMTYIIQKI